MRIERRLLSLPAAAFCVCCSTASALSLEFKPSAHVELQREDNVFRAANTPPLGAAPRQTDTLTRAGLGGRLTLRHSLQELELHGDVDRVNYAKLDSLDHDRYQFGLQGRLAMVSTLRLQLDAGRQRKLEDFTFREDTERGFITTDLASAQLRYAATPEWTAVSRLGYLRSLASRQASQDFDLSEVAAELGGEYRINGYSSFGLAFRQAEGDYPQRVVSAGDGREKDYRQQSLIGRASYVPSGLSDYAVELAFTRRAHDDSGVPDFSGLTGRLAYGRRFSGLSRVQVEVYRDLFYVQAADSNFVDNLGLRASLDYRHSAKLALAVAVERFQSSYRGTPAFSVGGNAREDEVSGIRVSAGYAPFYRFSIEPAYRYERRHSSLAAQSYDFSVIGLDLIYKYGELRSR